MGFYQDLAFGNDAERLLLMQHKFLTHATDRSHDLIIKGTKIKLELKNDSYDPKKYSNFIMERWSKQDKPGGPFQSLKNGCRYFMYNFAQTGQIYVFDTVQLVARIEKLVKKHELPLYDKHNVGYITQYYKIPISMLEDLNVGMEKLEKLYLQAKKKADKVR